MTSKTLMIGAALTGLALAAAPMAGATTYTESISDNPANFICSTAADIKTCYGFVFVTSPGLTGTGYFTSGSGIFTPTAGDTVNIDITFGAPVYVAKGTGAGPVGTGPYDLVFDELFALGTGGTYSPALDDTASSTVTGYVGPAGLGLDGSSNHYNAYVGFGGVYSSPAAFSITGIDSTLDLTQGSADPIFEVVYGYQVTTVPEPATWALLLAGFAGLGAAIRARRREPARAL
ncbi:MAG: PEPxxWA-CTERM sorting domain-containing protein [Caulobacteraceae bacterium]